MATRFRRRPKPLRFRFPRRQPRSAVVLPTMALAFVATLGALQIANRPQGAPIALADGPPARADAQRETVSASFALCSAGAAPCVVDGDTLRYDGRRIRILGIDTPELHPARCPAEERLGQAAKLRMQALVNAGPFQLVSDGRDRDVYGRDLRKLMRGTSDLGQQLVNEGLARPYGNGRQSWC